MVATNNPAKIHQVWDFLRSFAPQQLGQLLFVFGSLALFCAAFAQWHPSHGVFPSEEYKKFFQNIPPFSEDASDTAWITWDRFLLGPQVLIFAASLVAGLFTFVPSSMLRRPRWLWVYALSFAALGAIGMRLLVWSLQSGSVLESTSDRLFGFFRGIPTLALDLGPGLHLLLVGLMLLAIGQWCLRRGSLSLPVRFRGSGLEDHTRPEAGLSREITMFCVIALPSLGFFILLFMSLDRLGMFGMLPTIAGGRGAIPTWHLLLSWFPSLLPTAFLVFLALTLRGKAWKAALRAMLRAGAPVYYGLALLIPLLALAIPQLLIVGASKISWELEQALPTQPISLNVVARSFFWFHLMGLPGALLEEMAWRAYLLPLAITLMGLRRGIFVVGVVWAAWHLPYDVGTGADAMHVVAAVGSRLLLTGIHSIAFAWLFLRSRSALSAGLLHATFNLLIDWTWAWLPYTGEIANWLGLAVWAVGGYVLFKYWPPQRTDTAPGFSP